MPDASRSLQRTSGRSASLPAKSPDAHGTALPCVLGGLLRGQPELALLTKAAAGVATIELVDDRFALVSTVLASRPGVVVVPPFDAEHTSTAPLILRVRREAPAVAVLVLSSHPRGAGQPMVRAAQVGAHVITSPTTTELHEALASLLEPGATRQ
jgi:AmiR/NasT family two-component response regulator